MRREDKYPDTTTFHYYNANPHNKKTGDCVIRAICTALNQTWEQTVRELTEIGLKYGYLANEPKCYGRYLESKGYIKHSQPRHGDNTKYTGKEFCRLLNERINDGNNVIAHIGGHHIVTFVYEDNDTYRVYDIWNSTEGCIGNYWTKAQ